MALEFEGFPRCEREILELSLVPDAAGQRLPEVTIRPTNLVRVETTIAGSIAKSEGAN